MLGIDWWMKRRRVNERAGNFYETTTTMAEIESGTSVSGVLRSKCEWPPVVCYQEDRDPSRVPFILIRIIRIRVSQEKVNYVMCVCIVLWLCRVRSSSKFPCAHTELAPAGFQCTRLRNVLRTLRVQKRLSPSFDLPRTGTACACAI
jgi:hypothetical protein